MQDSKLTELRNKIDAIDVELLKLLAARADVVLEVGKVKHQSGCANNFIRSGREAQMLRELASRGAGHFPKPALRSMWRSIISASLALEGGMNIAIPHNAGFEFDRLVVEYFGSFNSYKQYESDAEIIDAIDKNTVGVFTLNSGWWLNLAEPEYSHLKIFARLSGDIFTVAKVEPEESGNDKTLAITHEDTPGGHRLASHGKVKLIEIDGFHTAIEDMVVIGNYGI